MQYDEIEFYYKRSKLGRTCLPEFSDSEIRKSLAKHLGIKNYDQFLIISPNGDIRLDSLEIKIQKGKRFYKIK